MSSRAGMMIAMIMLGVLIEMTNYCIKRSKLLWVINRFKCKYCVIRRHDRELSLSLSLSLSRLIMSVDQYSEIDTDYYGE